MTLDMEPARTVWDAASEQWFAAQAVADIARGDRIRREVAAVMKQLSQTAFLACGVSPVVLMAEVLQPVESATFRHVAAAYAVRLKEQRAELNEVKFQVSRLGLHRESIQIMAGNLQRLRWWQWRRRRNIEYHLAGIAIALIRQRKDDL